MFNPLKAIANLFTSEPALAPIDLLNSYEALLVAQSLDWWHDGLLKSGHIEAVVPSPYANDEALYALWYSDVDFALDYIPVEDAWQAVLQ